MSITIIHHADNGIMLWIRRAEFLNQILLFPKTEITNNDLIAYDEQIEV
jgi:hypothetical protein